MVKPRENRVPIMMSEEELKAIDDWRFANRIATRSDAVRRLTHIGITFDDHRKELLSAYSTILDEVRKGVPAATRVAHAKNATDLEKNLTLVVINTLSKLMSATLLIRTLTGIANNVKSDENFSEILKNSVDLTTGLKEEHDILMSEKENLEREK